MSADPVEISTVSPPLLRPASLQRVATNCLCILTVICVVGVIAYLGPIIIPVLAAIFLYFVIHAVAERLAVLGVPTWGTYCLLLVSLLAASYWLSEAIYEDVVGLSEQLPAMRERAKELAGHIPGVRPEQIDSLTLADMFNMSYGEVYQQLFGTASRVLESVLLVFFYLIFLLLDAHRIPGRFRRAFPEHAHKFQQGFRKISDEIGNYMWIKTLISAGMAVCAGVVMALFGMTDALLWVCLTFLLNYITYVGSLAALVPPIAIALLQFNSLWGALAFAALLCLNRSIWTDYMEIRFSGHQLRLNNVLLLFIIIFWGWFWGVIGMVLAVPILSALKIILAQFERTRAWSILMSED